MSAAATAEQHLGCGPIDPDSCQISYHARQRYLQRRNTRPEHAEEALRGLLRRASQKGLPPLSYTKGRMARVYRNVGGFTLVLSPDNGTLVTFWRNTK